MKPVVRALAFVFGLLVSLSALASALVESFNGDVRARASAAAAAAVATGQRINTGATVVTGPRSLVTLRFDDGQAVLLNENTEFTVTDYVFSKDEPAKDRYVFDLLRGAMRSVTGVLTRRNQQAYALRVPQATLGIRGTDFMVMLVNPAFMSVLSGAIEAANAAGAASFAAGATATIASATSLAVPIAAAALPAAVAASFSQMSSIVISATGTAAGTSTAGAGAPGGTGAGAGAATGAATGGVTLGTAALIGAAAAAIAAAVSSSNDTPTTGTTGTTGTR